MSREHVMIGNDKKRAGDRYIPLCGIIWSTCFKPVLCQNAHVWDHIDYDWTPQPHQLSEIRTDGDQSIHPERESEGICLLQKCLAPPCFNRLA